LVLTFGLGESSKVDELTVVWPDGNVQKLRDLDADQLHKIVESSPEAP
jgi:hypothetical protein